MTIHSGTSLNELSLAVSSTLNPVTENLKPYPMEELARIKQELADKGIEVYDFGTGDPKIPVEKFIVEAVSAGLSQNSQYPPIAGSKALESGHRAYLKNRFSFELDNSDDPENQTAVLPTRGSKEAVFHLALSVVGRLGKKNIIFPDPGYPVYESSTLFAGGRPVSYPLNDANNYLFEPWTLDADIIDQTAAVWVNYPHNPTGKTVERAYFEKLVGFCRKHDILVLSDDCYIDIYHSDFDKKERLDERPPFILDFGSKGVISLLSLSKRSGLTGFRAGCMVGDKQILTKLKRARANMGLAQTEFIAQGAEAAWRDETHVESRRRIFTERLEFASRELTKLGIDHIKPEATFYLWCKVPNFFGDDDVKFCLSLAEKGVITSPSSWLGKHSPGYFRMALVPSIEETKIAMGLIRSFIENEKINGASIKQKFNE